MNPVLGWLWAALPATVLIGIALVARRQLGSWIAPGAFFALTWTGLTWMALIVAPDFHVWAPAVWAIVGAVMSVYLGSILGASLWQPTTDETPPPRPALPGVRLISIAGTLLGVLGVLVLLRSLGQSPFIFFSPGRMAELGLRVASARYEEGYVEPFAVRLLMTGMYFSAMVGGCWAGLGTTRRRGLATWGTFIPAVLLSAVTTTRSAVLFCLVLWLGAYLAAALYVRQDFRRLVTRRTLLAFGIGFPVIVGGAALLQLSRYGLGLDGMLYVLDRLRVWIAGFLAGFATWLHASAATDLGTGAGAFTLAGPYNLLGIATRSLGIFNDHVIIADGYDINIYTIFRSVLEDFGLIGGAVALALFGAVGGVTYAGVRRGHIIWLPMLALCYALTLFSHITSLLNYNSIVLAWLGFALLLPGSRLYAGLATPRTP